MTLSTETRFLIVDDNADSRMLLAKTLMRKFPAAVVLECQQGDLAARLAQSERLVAIVARRTFDYEGEALVTLLRSANRFVPIVMVAGTDQSKCALAAGADAFLDQDAWLQTANVVADAINARRLLTEDQPLPDVAIERDAAPESEYPV